MGRHTATLAPLLAAALWGGMYVVGKWGFETVPPVTLAFLRVAVGGVTLLVIVRIRGSPRSFSSAEHRRFVVLGGWIALTLLTQFLGTDLTNASQGSLLTVLTPVFTLLLGIALLGEALTVRKTLGMAIAVVGTVMVLAGQYDLTRLGGGSSIGVVALLLASFGWAGYTVWGTPLVRRYSALETATYSTLWSVPMLAIAAAGELWMLGQSPLDLTITGPVIGAVLYLGVLSTAAAWYLWYRGVADLEAGVVAVFFFAQPVVGALLGTAFLGETLGPTFLAGGLVMALGIYVVSTSGANPEL